MYRAKGCLRSNPESAHKIPLGFPKQFDIGPTIRSTNDPANCEDNEVNHRMTNIVPRTRPSRLFKVQWMLLVLLTTTITHSGSICDCPVDRACKHRCLTELMTPKNGEKCDCVVCGAVEVGYRTKRIPVNSKTSPIPDLNAVSFVCAVNRAPKKAPRAPAGTMTVPSTNAFLLASPCNA